MADNQEPRSLIFARNVRQLREERGWSQAELGRRLRADHKLAQSRIAAIEATGSVTIDQADAFAVAFGVPIEVLLYADTDPRAARGTVIRQVQRLAQISNAVWDLREDINRLVADIRADLSGELPPGTIITADSVIDMPSLPESR